MKKHYHLHVNYGDNIGFSVFFHLTPVCEMNEADLIRYVIDQGLIEPDDDQYVDQVNEITEEEFNKGINRDKQ